MILDASIVLALVLKEPSAPWVLGELSSRSGEVMRMSWINIAEAGMVVARVKAGAADALQTTLARVGIEPLTLESAVVGLAIEARSRFPINFGDCFAYAHARLLNEPLMTLDKDFLKTDLPHILHPFGRSARRSGRDSGIFR